MTITGSTTVIKTGSSLLTMSQFSDRELMSSCVGDVKELLLHYPPITIFGKLAHQRRDVGFFSDESEGYKYSGQVAKSQALTNNLKKLLAIINQHYGAEFNGILINRYNNNGDYISPHSDDERYLDVKAGVVAISYGAERTFVIRGKKDTGFITGISLPDMSVVHMSGNFQKEFTHAIPPVLTSGGRERYSFTFRRHSE